MAFDLKIDQRHLVPGLSRRRRDQLEAERFEPQKDPREHQRTGMDPEDSHRLPLRAASSPAILGQLASAIQASVFLPLHTKTWIPGPSRGKRIIQSFNSRFALPFNILAASSAATGNRSAQ